MTHLIEHFEKVKQDRINLTSLVERFGDIVYLEEILSGPDTLFGFSSFRSFFLTSGIVVHHCPMSGVMQPSGFERTLENLQFSTSAFSFLSI